MQLTTHFSLNEMTRSQSAARFDIDNTPDEQSIYNLQVLCEQILQPLRELYNRPISISSGYRCPELNERIGGSSNSHHMRGMAADIEIFGIANGDLATYISQYFQFTQVILEFYNPTNPASGWVHVSYDPDDLKCEVLTSSRVNGRTVYTPGLQL
jgi:zinc D-Ala-D-Ala carboxypeptidase